MQAYCMKCRTKRDIKNPKSIVHKNGKPAITGTCSACGTKVFRMGKGDGTAAAETKASGKSKVSVKK